MKLKGLIWNDEAETDQGMSSGGPTGTALLGPCSSGVSCDKASSAEKDIETSWKQQATRRIFRL
jgi:hypothetical protein